MRRIILSTLVLIGSAAATLVIVAIVAVVMSAGLAGLAPIDTASAQQPYVLGEKLDRSRQPEAADAALAANAPGPAYKETDWNLLVPGDWDPMKAFENLNFGQMSDSDPRAINALRKMQEAWKNAPVNQQMNDSRIRIAGFVVPLDGSRDTLKEFLLVPYFGACIHVPPPPSNQIIHVVPPKGAKALRAMDPVWVSGTLTVERVDTSMGSSSYRMTGELVEPYTEAPAGKAR